MSKYVLAADLSPDRDKDCYTIMDTDTNTVVYVGNDLEQVRKYNFISVVIDEQDSGRTLSIKDKARRTRRVECL